MNQFSTFACGTLTFAHSNFIILFNLILIKNDMIYICFERNRYFLQKGKLSAYKAISREIETIGNIVVHLRNPKGID